MALENKILPQRCASLDINENNLVKVNKRKDSLSKFLLIVLVLALDIYYLIAFTSAYGPQNGTEGTLAVFIAILLLEVIYFIFILALVNVKDKNLSNSSHLYFFHQEKRLFKFVDNFSNASVSVSDMLAVTEQEVDENGNPIYYAEEVYDDEEDIFVIEAASTMLTKEKETTYEDLVTGFNESLESFGVHGDVAAGLISAMTFSKLIDATKIQKIVSLVFKALDNPNYVIHYDENSSITSQKVLINTFEYAKTHPNIPVFMMFDEIPASEFLNYLRPLYRYIDDLNGDYYISINGNVVYIPHNVYFLFALRDNESVFDISRRYLRYISIINATYTLDKELTGERKPFSVTINQLTNARRNALDNFSVEEATYKKLDLLFNMANEANGYVLQNKIQNKIEEFSSMLLSLHLPEDEVIDRCLAYNVIAAVVISSEPLKLTKDYNLTTLLDNEFGGDKMKLTKNMIRDYLNLFNNKGERK